MRNFILALTSTLLVMFATPPTKVNEQPQNVKKQSIIQPLQPTVYAQKQELRKVPTPVPTPVVQPTVQPVQPPAGTCADWMAQAGISDPDAVWLISKESGCNPNAQNPKSTAYGIFQFLDGTWAGVGCTKTSDPVQQMICGQKYVMARYGSWSSARVFHSSHNWF